MPLVRWKPAKPKPLFPCPACGSREFWWRQAILFDVPQVGEWLCSRCHPDPREAEEVPLAVELVPEGTELRRTNGISSTQKDCSECELLPRCEKEGELCQDAGA